ncbi:helix-turn-helix transcriptional regulator [Nonomuraea sp. NPDC004580]|uniref:helix-turn-helix domain-containing protein n=1 Tax=Nonomuraea sp. NPDC004580 TaxID=3154552 RepID=UPI00339E35FE
MGRPERKLDPEGGLIERFAHDLRQLRVAAGQPTYRIMGSRVGCSPSRLSEAAKGLRLPSLSATLDYVRACGVTDTVEWERRWHEINDQVKQHARAVSEPEPDAADETRGQERRPRVLWKVAAIAGAALALLASGAAFFWASGDAVPDIPTRCRSPHATARMPISMEPCVALTDGAVVASLDLRAVRAVDGAVAYVWLHNAKSRAPLTKTLRTCELGALAAGQARTCGPFAHEVPPGRYTTAVAVEPAPRRSEPSLWRRGATGTQSPQLAIEP